MKNNKDFELECIWHTDSRGLIYLSLLATYCSEIWMSSVRNTIRSKGTPNLNTHFALNCYVNFQICFTCAAWLRTFWTSNSSNSKVFPILFTLRLIPVFLQKISLKQWVSEKLVGIKLYNIIYIFIFHKNSTVSYCLFFQPQLERTCKELDFNVESVFIA